jgi:subtilisin family serine protease
VWEELGVRGAGIVIGQSDSGADWEHEEIRDAYRGQAGQHGSNWLDPWNATPAPVDANGHGTHTLGSVLGNRTGVAPDATWFACANLYRNLGNPALYLDCMQFMLAPYPQGGDPFTDGDPRLAAHVLNNSWGCPQAYEGCDATSLEPAVEALRAAGLFVVASAGNEGPGCSTLADAPAIYDSVLSVGAIDQDGDLAPFSSRGPVMEDGSGRTKPNIVAPGVGVLSSYPGNTYEVSSGTSMAGPHIAGVVALMWSANPGLIGDIEATEAILLGTTRPFTGSLEATMLDMMTELEGRPDAARGGGMTDMPGYVCGRGLEVTPNDYVGYGVVDAYAAVQMALEAGVR